jgi:hypothetical protein
LQADRQEDQTVEQEDQEFPHGVADEPPFRQIDLVGLAADEDPRDHGRKDAGNAERLAGEIDRVRGDQLDRVVDQIIGQLVLAQQQDRLDDQITEREADGDAAERDDKEREAGACE